jgi:surface antigen
MRQELHLHLISLKVLSRKEVRELRSLSKLFVVVVFMASIVMTSSASADTGGYPDWKVPCSYFPYSTTGLCTGYDWGYVHHDDPSWKESTTYSSRGYGYRNCTDYVAWKLESLGISTSLTRNRGSGKQWDDDGTGVNIVTTPEVGDAAVWNSGDYGHVAFVEEVRARSGGGYEARISEYNKDETGAYRNDRWVRADSYVDFNGVNTPVAPPAWPGVGPITYRGEGISSGDSLYPNQYIASGNLQYALVFQNDGNLVLYHGDRFIWEAQTGSKNASRLVMQTDGNLVMYRPDNSVVWKSITGGHPGAYANLQPDGNFVVRDGGVVYWWTNTGGHANLSYFGLDRLNPGQQLTQNQYLRSSDGRYALLLQTDGNLVLYGPGYHVLWQTFTGGAGDRLVMQTDGNLVLYALTNPQWWVGASAAGSYVMLQSDGNLVLYNGANFPVWFSGTGGKI